MQILRAVAASGVDRLDQGMARLVEARRHDELVFASPGFERRWLCAHPPDDDDQKSQRELGA